MYRNLSHHVMYSLILNLVRPMLTVNSLGLVYVMNSYKSRILSPPIRGERPTSPASMFHYSESELIFKYALHDIKNIKKEITPPIN